MMRIEITEKFLELFGTGTLTGTIVSNDGKFPDKLTLVFPQTDLEWRRKNNGPKHYVMPEFVPFCLVLDVLELQRRGVEIAVETTTIREA